MRTWTTPASSCASSATRRSARPCAWWCCATARPRPSRSRSGGAKTPWPPMPKRRRTRPRRRRSRKPCSAWTSAEMTDELRDELGLDAGRRRDRRHRDRRGQRGLGKGPARGRRDRGGGAGPGDLDRRFRGRGSRPPATAGGSRSCCWSAARATRASSRCRSRSNPKTKRPRHVRGPVQGPPDAGGPFLCAGSAHRRSTSPRVSPMSSSSRSVRFSERMRVARRSRVAAIRAARSPRNDARRGAARTAKPVAARRGAGVDGGHGACSCSQGCLFAAGEIGRARSE